MKAITFTQSDYVGHDYGFIVAMHLLFPSPRVFLVSETGDLDELNGQILLGWGTAVNSALFLSQWLERGTANMNYVLIQNSLHFVVCSRDGCSIYLIYSFVVET